MTNIQYIIMITFTFADDCATMVWKNCNWHACMPGAQTTIILFLNQPSSEGAIPCHRVATVSKALSLETIDECLCLSASMTGVRVEFWDFHF